MTWPWHSARWPTAVSGSATRTSCASPTRPTTTSSRRTSRRSQDTAVSPQAAYVMTDILASNTDPDQNRDLGRLRAPGTGRTRRPATIKTGTNQDANDLVAFGYIAPPDAAEREQGEYALVVGAWGGNSDGSPVLTPENPVLSTDMAAPLWHGFLSGGHRRLAGAQLRRDHRASSKPKSTPGAACGRPQFTTRDCARSLHRWHSACRGQHQGRPCRSWPPARCRSTRTRRPIPAPHRLPTTRRMAAVGRRLRRHARDEAASSRSRESKPAIRSGRLPTPTGSPGQSRAPALPGGP